LLKYDTTTNDVNRAAKSVFYLQVVLFEIIFLKIFFAFIENLLMRKMVNIEVKTMPQKNFLLTGLPGVGKTMVITRLSKLLGDKANGFYTSEIRVEGNRKGFEIVSLSGKKAVLAHVNFSSKNRVGKYGVIPENLNEAINEISQTIVQNTPKCLLIDEIGKMELFAPQFREIVLAALNSSLPVAATILAKPHPFCDTIKKRQDVRLIEVNRQNREKLPEELYRLIISCLGIP